MKLTTISLNRNHSQRSDFQTTLNEATKALACPRIGRRTVHETLYPLGYYVPISQTIAVGDLNLLMVYRNSTFVLACTLRVPVRPPYSLKNASSHRGSLAGPNFHNIITLGAEYISSATSTLSKHLHTMNNHINLIIHPLFPQPSPSTFHLFPLLPLELQQLIWATYLNRHIEWARKYALSVGIWAHDSRIPIGAETVDSTTALLGGLHLRTGSLSAW